MFIIVLLNNLLEQQKRLTPSESSSWRLSLSRAAKFDTHDFRGSDLFKYILNGLENIKGSPRFKWRTIWRTFLQIPFRLNFSWIWRKKFKNFQSEGVLHIAKNPSDCSIWRTFSIWRNFRSFFSNVKDSFRLKIFKFCPSDSTEGQSEGNLKDNLKEKVLQIVLHLNLGEP